MGQLGSESGEAKAIGFDAIDVGQRDGGRGGTCDRLVKVEEVATRFGCENDIARLHPLLLSLAA